MGTLGYAAMFEQFAPNDLLKWSRMAEDAGFGSVMASDHFHPWSEAQGQSGFSFAYLKELFLSSMMRWISHPEKGSMAAVITEQCGVLREQMHAMAEVSPAETASEEEEE